MTTGPAHWELLQRCRAVDNQVYKYICRELPSMKVLIAIPRLLNWKFLVYNIRFMWLVLVPHDPNLVRTSLGAIVRQFRLGEK